MTVARVARLHVFAITLALGTSAWAVPVAPDDFEDGTTQGWVSGFANPNPPVNMTGGGLDGPDDHYLLATSTGTGGAGGRLVIFNMAQWTGDYLAAGLTTIGADVNNLGNNDLDLRLALDGAGGWFATDSVPLPAGSGWQHVEFSVAAADLISASGFDASLTLGAVETLRMLHNPVPGFVGEPIAAELGVDNIVAIVPEPSTFVLAAIGIFIAFMARPATVSQRS